LTALDFWGDERRASQESRQRPQSLPPSPFDLFTEPNTYWAGNLNVFVGGKAVERHQAKALRIMPERTNVAFFVVGGRDSYRFDLRGLSPDWKARIFNPVQALAMSRGLKDGTVIQPGTWAHLPGHTMLLLALGPPAGCREASVEVHVSKRSTMETAVVEFSFDTQACGPGCYVVE
jgi:hypothetical protein